MSFAAVLATLVLAGLASLQALVAAGRPYGRLVWGGQHETLPPRLRVGSAMAIVIYAVIAWVLLARAEMFGPSRPFTGITTWVIFGYFTLGIALNAISRSRAERLVMTPACVALAACSLTVALS
jgi:hypothetical protein